MGRRGRTRRGLRPEPRDGWPLDGVLVGVATLRTMRELFRQLAEPTDPPRAWDLALWSGVTPQGSIDAMDRLHSAGLVVELPPSAPHRAPAYRLDPGHVFVDPLTRLFEIERKQSIGKEVGYDGRSPIARGEQLRHLRRARE